MPAITTRGLRKTFGEVVAVHGLDLTVEPGTVYGLIGPNGAGKTTALRMLLDIIRPTAGTARVLDEPPRAGGPALRRRIGFIPGELRLPGRMRGRDLLGYYTDLSGPVTPGAIDTLAERLSLDLDKQVRALSKGNKQKLGLVQAFMHRPELLILDEPTSGLDPLVQREFLTMIREARDGGQTVLLSSHMLSEIQQAADRVAVLNHGRLVADGDVASLRVADLRHLRAMVAAPAEQVLAALRRIPHVSDIATAPDDGTTRLTAVVDGDIDPVVKAIAEFTVIDLAIEQPDLEESVLRLYGGVNNSDPEEDARG